MSRRVTSSSVTIVVCLWSLQTVPWSARAAEAVTLPPIQVDTPDTSRQAPTTFHDVITPPAAMRQLSTVSELIDRSPSTRVRSLGSPGQFASVSIRGSSAEQVAVYLDGARLNSGGFGTVDISTIPVAMIDRIEVIRGGGTAQFGGDAIGGVVNIITKRGAPGRSIELEVGGGSFLTLHSAASFTQQSDTQALVGTHTHHSSRGDYPFTQASTTLAGTTIGANGSFTREHNQHLSEAVLLKYDRTIADAYHLNMSTDFVFVNRELPGTEIETTQLAPANPLEATQRVYRNTAHASLRRDAAFALDALSLSAGTHHVLEWNGFRDPSPALGAAIDRRSLSQTISPFGLAEYRIERAWGTHDLALRYEYHHDYFADTPRNATTTTTGTHQRHTQSIMGQDTWWLLPERLLLQPTLRYTHNSDFGDDLSYRFGIIGKPVRALSLKANLETTRRVPTFMELYFPDQGFIRGNPDLAKESAWHWDAGALLDTRVVRAEAAYFQQYINNSILFVPISATTIAPINTFAVRSDGIETSVAVTPLEYLELSGNYTWQRARFTSNQQQVPGRARHQANGRVVLSGHLGRRWRGQILADVQWVDTVPINVDNTAALAARTTLDMGLRGTWKTTRGHEYSAGLQLQNVTNVPVYDARGFPLPGRSLLASVGGRWL